MVADSISSPSNPRIKALAGLKKARVRARDDLFLIEGEREVARAIGAGVDIETMLVCEELLTGDAPVTPVPVDVLQVAEPAMKKVSVRQNPSGLIAVARRFDTSLSRLDLGPMPLVLIAERVEKPGNLGAMMRTADAVGADAVVVADTATDVFNPNVVRASLGALFLVPLAVASTVETIEWARMSSMQLVAGYPEATTAMWDVDMTGPTAIVVGAEDAGLGKLWTEPTTAVSIPMVSQTDSLNASVAAALLLYEAVRQRRIG